MRLPRLRTCTLLVPLSIRYVTILQAFASLFSGEAYGTHLEAFTGVAPFAGRHRRLETAIVEIGLHGHRRLPQPDDISDGLWEIIRCCWEYDPATRPHMGYVVDALIALIPRSRPGPALSIKDHLKRVPTVAPLSP